MKAAKTPTTASVLETGGLSEMPCVAITADVPETTSVASAVPQSSRGIFITFEGGDGAGKSTQIELLSQYLESRGKTVVQTLEPGGTELGRNIRELLLHGGQVSPRAEALLYAADRAQHVDCLIRPALEAGQVVISDRYIDSSLAYQGGARDLGEEITQLSQWATQNLWPDVTVLLDIDPRIGLRRAMGAEPDIEYDRMEAESLAFHEAVRARFLELATADPSRYLVVDATLSREEIATKIRARIDEHFSQNLTACEHLEKSLTREAGENPVCEHTKGQLAREAGENSTCENESITRGAGENPDGENPACANKQQHAGSNAVSKAPKD
ncbi:dTMP kinase [Actinotignum urinale]|uniref:Thymidylate kinase n=1 Tax=Actinotignum urinale TaxID=190146 RepID=A0AAW9HKA5_9ACTO|nr:dTMP kinase [Actinotignum urinale]MDY5154341.1 dTMP kinase [Actinotignum urinale]